VNYLYLLLHCWTDCLRHGYSAKTQDAGDENHWLSEEEMNDRRGSGDHWLYPAFFCFDVGSFGVLVRGGKLALGTSALLGIGWIVKELFYE